MVTMLLTAFCVQATIYTDATNDIPGDVDAFMDITQVDVTNDATNLNVVITFAAEGMVSNEYARFGIGIDSTTNGSTTADAWNDKIIMSSGMDFWGGGWTVQGTNTAGLNVYDASLGDWPEWLHGGDGSTWVYYWGPEFSSNTVSFGISLATLGLSAGDTFDFDIYSFWNDGYPSDALGVSSLIPWVQYDSGVNVSTYTVATIAPPTTVFIDVSGTNVTIDFLAYSNVSYYVQSTTSLTQTWANASSLILGDGTTNSSAYPATNNAEFYRVVEP